MTDSAQQFDPCKPLWSIMTKSRGGTVSMIRDLTLEEAQKIYERLDPWYGSQTTIATIHEDFLPEDGYATSFARGGGRTVKDGDIEIREVFGPAGWRGFKGLKSWPVVVKVYTDGKGDILPDEYQKEPLIAQFYRKKTAAW